MGVGNIGQGKIGQALENWPSTGKISRLLENIFGQFSIPPVHDSPRFTQSQPKKAIFDNKRYYWKVRLFDYSHFTC